jgi:hypothetical protein
VVNINKQSAIKFIKSIVCRFGLLNRIITDNGSQFTSSAFQWYYEDLGIQICYASIAHPESNGQVERANAEILNGLRTRTYDGLKKHGKNGLMSFCAHYRVTGLHPVGPLEKHLSSWCTGLRLSSPRKSPRAPSMSIHTTKPRKTSSGAKMLTLLTKEDGNLLLKMHGTTKHSGAISSGSCIAGSSRWMIWCSGGCSLRRVPTSSPPAGRDPSE